MKEFIEGQLKHLEDCVKDINTPIESIIRLINVVNSWIPMANESNCDFSNTRMETIDKEYSGSVKEWATNIRLLEHSDKPLTLPAIIDTGIIFY